MALIRSYQSIPINLYLLLFQLHYDIDSKLIAASLQCYLLEVNRVCKICAGEQNYHIFNAILNGDSEMIAELKLNDINDFAVSTFRYIYV